MSLPPSSPLPPALRILIIIRVREFEHSPEYDRFRCAFFSFIKIDYAILCEVCDWDCLHFSSFVILTGSATAFLLPFIECTLRGRRVCVCSRCALVHTGTRIKHVWMTTCMHARARLAHETRFLHALRTFEYFVHSFFFRFDNDAWFQLQKNFMWRKCH